MKKKISDAAYNIFLITAGSLITAFAIKAFLVPQEFISRGATGISLMISYKTDILPLGVIYFLINIPIFALGWKFVGRRFTVYSLIGMAIYTVILGLMPFQFHMQDKMLCAVIAGGLSGIGLAIALRSYGSAGGADVLYIIINKMTGMSIGTSSMIINAVIIGSMAAFFPLENVLYTLVYIFVNMYVTNKTFHGFAHRRAVLIMSEKSEVIAEHMKKEHFAFTVIDSKGGYKGTQQKILYSVVERKKISYLKRSILKTDPKAFIAVMTAEDVTGVEIGNQPHW